MSVVVKTIQSVVLNESVIAKMQSLIDAHNEPLKSIERPKDWDCYYEIGVTGCKEAYFTLYSHTQTGARYVSNMQGMQGGLIMQNRYVQNLSMDFESAVVKCLDMLKDSTRPIHLYADDTKKYTYNNEATIVRFGKYKGCAIEDVAEKDIRYLTWMRDTMTEKSGSKYFSKLDAEVLDNINAQIDFYWDKIRKHNEETCKSTFVGAEGDKIENIILKVTRSFIEKDEYGQVLSEVVEMIDDNDNLFKMYIGASTKNFKAEKDNEGNVTPFWKRDVYMKIARARVASHYTKLGKKYTRLNNVKFA